MSTSEQHATKETRLSELSFAESGPSYSDKDTQQLRIAASDVAAVTGYHEWVDVRELFLDRLLYQDLDHVLRRDVENLGLELEERNKRTEKLLAKTGDDELRKIRTRAGDGVAIATVKDAQALQRKARVLLKKAEASNKLSREEVKELRNELNYDINTQFGTRNEDVALREYERRTGNEVFCSNERILAWQLPGSREGDGVPTEKLEPPPSLTQGWLRQHQQRSFNRPRKGTSMSWKSPPVDQAFSLAVKSCLKQFIIRATLEDILKQVVMDSPDHLGTSFSAASDSIERAAESAKVEDSKRIDGERAVDESQHRACLSMAGDHEERAGGLRKATELRRSPASPRSDVPSLTANRELVPGLSFPEFRPGTSYKAPVATSPSVDTSNTRVTGSSLERAQVSPGQEVPPFRSASLWFSSDLGSRQRATVHDAARELDLGHKSVDELGRRRLVVWESKAVVSSSSSGSWLDVQAGDVGANKNSKIVGATCGENVSPGDIDHGSDNVRCVETGKWRPVKGPEPSPGDSIVPLQGSVGNGVNSGVGIGKSSCPEDVQVDEGLAGTAGGVPDPEERAGNGESGTHVSKPGLALISPGPRQTYNQSARTVDLTLTSDGYSSSEAAEHCAGVAPRWMVPAGDNKSWGGAPPTDGDNDVELSRRDVMMDRADACFVLVGAIDGMSEEIADIPEDGDTLKLRRVVVEVKNRMGSARHPPPLYDQIQLVTYMIMTGVAVGDLVQFVKRSSSATGGRRAKRCAKRQANGGSDEIAVEGGMRAAMTVEERPEISISRVELDCSSYHHQENWYSIVLPRLYKFARMVYKFRADDTLRWRYLLAGSEEQREMLVECCPYLDSVIPRAAQ